MSDLTEFNRMEQDGWRDAAIAQGYADGFQMAAGQMAAQLAQAVQAGPGDRVLDLCTGPGAVAAALLARGAGVVGLDFSPVMVAMAQRAVPQAEILQGDAMALTFPDSSFDAVTIGFGVPHFPDPAKGLAEAARVLKPGGRLAFSIWRGKGSDGAFGWLFDAVARLGDPAVTLPPGPDAHMLVDRALAGPMVTAAGFADVQLSEVATQMWVTAPDRLFDAFAGGAVRAAALLDGQSDARRTAIRADLADRTRLQGTPAGGGSLVPAPSVVISARRA